MPVIGNTYLTLADVFRRKDSKDQHAAIIEMMAQFNPILWDAVVRECNDGARHLTSIRTGLPTAVWRKLYQAVQPSKSRTAQVYDTTGMLEAWSEVDAKLVDMEPNKAVFRLSEAQSFIEAMQIEMAYGLFYHDTDEDPEKFMGLAPRFSDSTAPNGRQIVKAGGSSTNNTSIWFVTWGEQTCHLLYPKGSKGGLSREDKGKQTKETTEGVYDVYREKFTWDIGMSVRDWRFIARVANIDVTALEPDASSGADLIDAMVTAYYRLHNRRKGKTGSASGGGKLAIYCNTTIAEFLHKQAANRNNMNLRLSEYEGEEIVKFMNIPIRECDAILDTEGTVA